MSFSRSRWVRAGCRAFEGADLVVGELQVDGGCGVVQVVGLGGADDGCGDDRVLQHPGHRYGRHRDAAVGGDALDGVDDRAVRVEEQGRPCPSVVGLFFARDVLCSPRGRVTSPAARGLQGMLPTPWSASRPNISRSSSRWIRLYWSCMETNLVQPWMSAACCIVANCQAHIEDAPR